MEEMEETIFMKRGEARYKTKENGKLFRMLMKSERMEAIISELDLNAASKFYKHDGEEMHIVLKGEIEYEVGEKKYAMKEGDVLWHRSNLPHRAKNIGREKAVYLTIGSPPTFM
jgi:quercetin dioxygenase-like cupin family protein